MGFSSPDSDLKGMALEDEEGICKSPSRTLWKKALELKALRRRQHKKLWLRAKMGIHRFYRRPKIFMKRRASLEGSRKPLNGVERRIKVLQKLLPNGSSMGLDGLFMMAADYILCLEMQVKVMQIMVNIVSDSN
ncbi:hypothetical protein MRB53_029044 [Persea americana]|uniref:Uncharacterized protein n=1 Tax=Persea americana TaxID=3435 RepID=A0ACC2KHS0_PERAE|nr:hypothetical protein MRB53_029044 [Persea americana]